MYVLFNALLRIFSHLVGDTAWYMFPAWFQIDTHKHSLRPHLRILFIV